jgi:hypothetical protein
MFMTKLKSYLPLITALTFTANASDDDLNKIEKESKDKLSEFEKRVERGDDLVISGSYSPWFVNWEQRSLAAERFGHYAIDVDYTIEDSIAHNATLAVSVWGIDFDFSLVELPEDSANADRSLSALSYGINFTELFGGAEIGYRYSEATFTGTFEGVNFNGQTGTQTFETNSSHHDIVLMTKWGIGLGYRSFSYSLPQDIYTTMEVVVDREISALEPNPPRLVSSYYTNMEYTADFLAVVFERENLLNNSDDGLNLGYQFKYGTGTMEASNEELDKVLAGLAQEGFPQDKLINDGDAQFIEFDFYASYPVVNSEALKVDLTLGYRYELTEVSFGYVDTITDIPEGRLTQPTFSVVADFETEMSGAYATVNFTW